ncbi:protein kinase [Hypoxylon sp. NC1633]|nr:protein kinase [Hypoxylon sp. NC1633]
MAPTAPKKRLGLDDPERVRKIHDRGEGDLHTVSGQASHQRPRSGRYEPIAVDVDHLLGVIGGEFDESTQTSALDTNKVYLSRPKLLEILTPRRVRTIVGHPCFRDYPDKDRLTTEICFGSKSKSPRLKLLAVLIVIEKALDLPKHMRDGMDDRCLPMEMDSMGKRNIYCRWHKQYHATINGYNRPRYRMEFSSLSYSLTAPYIRYDKRQHSHYVLHPGDVFPMQVGKKVQKEEVPGSNFGGPMSTIPQYGGFSEVYQVQIEEGHYKFDNVGMRHPHGFFALKKLNSHRRDDFNLELASLLFSMDQASDQRANNHLIQLLATFEVSDSSAQGTCYYLLFDWAEGTLKDFWRVNSILVGSRSHSIWMSQQFHEICMAVQCVHNERDRTLQKMDTSRLAKGPAERTFTINDLYGRHGDIKPDNFLWFQPARPLPDILALSDFGLGKLHTQVSRSNQDPKNLARTATYVAPEFDLRNGMISRASDIFSLGCVFLEHTTWYMRGIDSVENEFPARRTELDVYGFDADKFFVIRKEPNGEQRPLLKPQVKDWISELQQDRSCTWYLYQLLEIIRDKMLEPDREKRSSITDLIDHMKKLRRACERDDSFYLKTISES